MRMIAAIALGLALSACASTSVRPVVVPIAERIDEVCIERNPAVQVSDFLPTLEAGFRRHGVRTRVFEGRAPCSYRVTYTATRRWDFTAFLSNARISVYRENELIGEATYDLPSGLFGGGGASPAKWASTASKIDPLIDQLMASSGQAAP